MAAEACHRLKATPLDRFQQSSVNIEDDEEAKEDTMKEGKGGIS